MNYKKSMNYDNWNSCYVLFNPQVQIIKSFSLRGPAKSVRISKSLNYRGLNYTGFSMGVCYKKFWGDQGILNYMDSN